MSAGRLPCRVRIAPWMRDHFIGDDKKVVLPAVETVLFLAGECAARRPEADIRVMEEVRFGRFLEVPPDATEVPALMEENVLEDGRIRLKLASRMRFKAVTRVKEHGDVSFPGRETPLQAADVDPAPPAKVIAEIDSESIYRHLVPFGPHYRTLQGTLLFTEGGAWGRLKVPELPFTHQVQERLGSPFPLDGAMHAACVLGQRLVDFAPFPVGWARRAVHRPTRPGGSYFTRVWLTAENVGAMGELVFDLAIFDDEGTIHETVSGLRMRDVGASVKK